MVKMEVKVMSREFIKPSSPAIHHQKPCSLSLLDQLIPTTYSPLIFFYPKTDNPDNNANSTLTRRSTAEQLKKSLSEALNLYYPLSGRVKDNHIIHDFDEGIPFFEASVNCTLSHFIKHLDIDALNHFLSFQPFTKELDARAPLSAFQVTTFSCGGMALGWNASHKLIDGGTAKAFLATWSAISRGDVNGVVNPDFNEASQFFPPRDPVPSSHLSTMEKLWFTEKNRITRRFVFDARAIARIKAMAKGDVQTKVTRIEALSCFIWKCCMAATNKTAEGSAATNTSILVEAVNLRTRTEPPMSGSSMGDIFWWATALANPTDENKLHDLVNLLNESISLLDGDYTKSLQGEEGFEAISEYCNQLEELFSNETPDIFAFTSWCHLGFTKADFGWGEPFWTGLMGRVGPAFRNLTVFIETKDGSGIEAWITLDEKKMWVLEHDPEFLALASPNPKMISVL